MPSILHASPFVLLGLLLSPTQVVYASSSQDENVHFCAFDDHEWRQRDHPHPAAKRPANLNVGEPRTVRMIYFLPNDRSYRQEVVDSIKTEIKRVQTFYAEQMEANGYGARTFRIETDPVGRPLVHRVDGQHPERHYYRNTLSLVDSELAPTFDLATNVYVIVIDNSSGKIGVSPHEEPWSIGRGRRVGKGGGAGYITGEFRSTHVALIGHEIGHAFGLLHDNSNSDYVMSQGPGQTRLSACHAEFLAVHPYFNADSPIEEESPPTVTVTSPLTYPAGSTSVPVHVEVEDSDGVHQVSLLYASWDLIGCRGVKGEENAVVEFDFSGSTYARDDNSLHEDPTQPLTIIAVDTRGNTGHHRFQLVRDSPEQIATLEGHTRAANSVAFSPDGATLASGSDDGTLKLWNVATQTGVATLEGHTGGVNSVAFSPDGATLASGSDDGTLKLWNVATQTGVATLEGHTGGVNSVAFSPDGATLASGSDDGTLKLWDVATIQEKHTLTGHTASVSSVAFSSDGNTLASASRDGTVRMWDVVSRTEIVTLEGDTRGMTSVAFSPDGMMLAAGSRGSTIMLWDVASRVRIANLEYQCDGWQSVAFSPGGAILAGAAGNSAVYLWDARARERVATLTGQTGSVLEAVFSSDGATLAAGSRDNTVNLWDTSRWTRPRPFALEIVSGDRQQGAPGSVLTQPLVVLVKDQHGNPLPDAPVTFKVTGGDGRLNNRYTSQQAISDANGHAELTLTLGPRPGTYAVGVFVGSVEVATFRSEGVETGVASLEGDYTAWHLPSGAAARLGRGTMGWSDRAVALSPDGRTLAVASSIGVWLYEVATSQALALLPSTKSVHSVSFSPDGTLAAGLGNGSVKLWDVESGAWIATLEGHMGASVDAVVFSPDGRRLVSGSWDQVIHIRDVATRVQLATWEVVREGYGWSVSLSFSPDGSRLVSGFDDGTVRLWDLATRAEVATLEGHKRAVTSVAYSPKGDYLASAGAHGDGTVILWDVTAQSQVATLDLPGVSYAESVVFSPDGAVLFAGLGLGSRGAILVWDVETGSQIGLIRGHEHVRGGVNSMAVSPDGATLASASSQGILLRDLETQSSVTLYGHVQINSMALSDDGNILATALSNSQVDLWNTSTQSRIATLSWDASLTAPHVLQSVAISPDGGTLAAGSLYRLHLWDLETRREISTLKKHPGWIPSAAFSPDGALLATGGGVVPDGGQDRTIRLWDVTSRTVVSMLEGHMNDVMSLSFSPEGSTLASGSRDNTARLWDVASRTEIATLAGHGSAVRAVSFSTDGSILASGAEDHTIKLWEVGTWSLIGTMHNRSSVFSLAFSRDGTTLASGAGDRTVRLWDVETRNQITTLGRHSSRVHSVVFSPDGRTLISGSGDGTMLLWDVARYLAPSNPNPDFDGDGTVGFADFLKFAAQFGMSRGEEGYDARFDLDGNGAIGFSDFLIFAGAFGTSTA
ncbi:MAG: Ig-like domain-containing protein [Gemmatimonadota bacterium]|nr:Ig-like domain-containing protein [Gemmatimonadota bacterium]